MCTKAKSQPINTFRFEFIGICVMIGLELPVIVRVVKGPGENHLNLKGNEYLIELKIYGYFVNMKARMRLQK